VAGRRPGRCPGRADYIYNDRYRKIAEVKAGNGYPADGQEFLTPWNTALILANTVTTANLTSIGGREDQEVVNSVVQEIDIRTGRVLFQWSSDGHIPYTDSRQPRRPRPPPRGTGATSTPSTSTPTATC
jgi:hypothetical protein